MFRVVLFLYIYPPPPCGILSHMKNTYNILDMDQEPHVELFLSSYVGEVNQPHPEGFENLDYSQSTLPGDIEENFHRHIIVYHESSELASHIPSPSMYFKDYGFKGYQLSVWTLASPVLPDQSKAENLFFMVQESIRHSVKGKLVENIPSPWFYPMHYSTLTWKLASLRGELFLHKCWNKTMASEFSSRGGQSTSERKKRSSQKTVIIAQTQKQNNYKRDVDDLVASKITACELAVREKITFRAAVERLKRAYKKSDEAYDGSITSFDAEKYARIDDGKVVPLLGTPLSLEESIEELYHGSEVAEVKLGRD